MDERIAQLVDEWDRNNGMALLGDHRDDLIWRIEQLLQRVANVCDRHKRQLLPEPTAMLCEECQKERIVHWLADVDALTVLCGDRKPGEKFTLDSKLLTCSGCQDALEATC